MALENLIVYRIVSGDSTYPHSGNFQISNAGSIIIDDSNGSRDAEMGDFTHTGGSDVPDQNVTSSTVTGINVNDTVDSRYLYTFTGSDGSSGTIYFLATNGTSNYGPLIVSTPPLDPAVTYTFGTFNTDGAFAYSSVVQCFTRGTLIDTPAGKAPVEHLSVGQKVTTRDSGDQEIRWIVSRLVPAIGDMAPVRIAAGALGNDRDLFVSPQHRMLINDWRAELLFGAPEVFASAKSLVNGRTIDVAEGGMVEYFHILFDNHEVVFAEGAATESFHPGRATVDALSEAARTEILTLFPELAANASTYGPTARPCLRNFEGRLLSVA